MGAGFYGGFGATKGSTTSNPADNEEKSTNIPLEQALIAELEKNGAKFTKQDIVFITKDGTGQIVWLENGNSSAGLEHILNGDGKTPGHAADFEKAFGVKKSELSLYLQEVITHGQIVSNKIIKRGSHEGYERVYYYEGNYHVVTGIGKNGFIVSAYPKKRKG